VLINTNTTCTIEFTTSLIFVKDGTFDHSSSSSLLGAEVEADHISGQFTSVTTAIGEYTISICYNIIADNPKSYEWSAEWKNP
jgi:hypothetical protein